MSEQELDLLRKDPELQVIHKEAIGIYQSNILKREAKLADLCDILADWWADHDRPDFEAAWRNAAFDWRDIANE